MARFAFDAVEDVFYCLELYVTGAMQADVDEGVDELVCFGLAKDVYEELIEVIGYREASCWVTGLPTLPLGVVYGLVYIVLHEALRYPSIRVVEVSQGVVGGLDAGHSRAL